MATKFLNVGDCYAGYRDVVTGEFTTSEWTVAWNNAQIVEACANGGEWAGEFDDPRLVCGYIATAEDRDANREAAYVSDVLTTKSGIVAEDPQYGEVFGWTVLPSAGHVVRCWYCNSDFSFREYEAACVDSLHYKTAGDTDEALAKKLEIKKAFVAQMLVHYSEHRTNGDLPFVTTYFPGKEIRRPNGDLVATKPGVVRTWRVTGELVTKPKSGSVCRCGELTEDGSEVMRCGVHRLG